jgi:predicted nucleic acid-binding protein
VIYFDSSYIIKCYIAEPGSAQVLGLAQSHPGRASALPGRIEFWSGVKRHVRERHLSIDQADAVWRQFVLDEAGGLWLFLPITRWLIEASCTRLAALPAGIVCRAADAIHLTCAKDVGFSHIYSNDRHLLAAAPYFGLVAKNVIT